MSDDRRDEPGKRASTRAKPLSEVRSRARKLAHKTGLPESVALSVVRGDRELSEAIAALARADQVEKLMQKHGIGKGVATQAAIGELDLEEYLLKQRLKAYLTEHRERSILTELEAASGDALVAVHGQTLLRGVITEVTPYEVGLSVDGAPAELTPKLQIKYAALGSDAGALASSIVAAPDAGPADPIPAPQDRYHLADRHLMSWMESGSALRLRTLEGDLIRGSVEWFSRWEIGLLTRDAGLRVGVFRHAIAHLEMD